MGSERMAEWALRRCTDRKRAAAVVGDLLELREQKGRAWFWMAVGGAMLRLAWRRPLAWCGGFYAGMYAFAYFQMAIWGIHVKHQPAGDYVWSPAFGLLSAAGSILCLMLIYSAIRYGLRDRLTLLALILAAFTTPVVYFWWKSWVVAACLVSCAAVLTAAMLRRRWRNALIILLIVEATGFAGGLLAMYLAARYQLFIAASPLGDREFAMHHSVLWVSFSLMVGAACLMMAAGSRLHDRLLPREMSEE
jgi:hypothetical protein